MLRVGRLRAHGTDAHNRVVRAGGRGLRIIAGADRNSAILSPIADALAPSPSMVRTALEELAAAGVTSVVTAALSDPEHAPFAAAGGHEISRLHLLRHDLADLPRRTSSGPRTRRAGRADHGALTEIDDAAFESPWRLGSNGLSDAMTATPTARLRVAGGHPATAFAITGRTGGRGYIQRLAVAPAHQHRGLGRALLVDGLRWLRRHGASSALINTQYGNEVALGLYRRQGFQMEPTGLLVLAFHLDDPPDPGYDQP